MAQLAASIVSHDEEFKRNLSALLRAGGVPVGIVDARAIGEGAGPDVVVVDIRGDASSGMAAIERLRANHPSVGIFAIAASPEPDLILQAMRAGANEFFPWNPGGATQASRAMEESFHGAVRRTAARQAAASAGARQPCVTQAFLGAKGVRGRRRSPSTARSNWRGSRRSRPSSSTSSPASARWRCFSACARGSRCSTRSRTCTGSTRTSSASSSRSTSRASTSSPGSEQFDRPNAQDAGAIEELLRVLSRTYEYIVIDAGNMINACAVAALYAADTVFLVTNPDVPSIRNAQRLVDRVRQLGAGSERVKILLNRTSDQHLIAPKQIETALGLGIYHAFSSDYRTVSTALNSGVPLALANHSELSAQFGSFTRHLLGIQDEVKAEPEKRRAFLGIL